MIHKVGHNPTPTPPPRPEGDPRAMIVDAESTTAVTGPVFRKALPNQLLSKSPSLTGRAKKSPHGARKSDRTARPLLAGNPITSGQHHLQNRRKP
jgi:hypothetical protein